jgi:hypothetical protein
LDFYFAANMHFMKRVAEYFAAFNLV